MPTNRSSAKSQAAPSQSPKPLTKVLTVDDVAALLQVKKTWIYTQVQSGDLPYYRLKNRRLRFNEQAVAEWLAQQHVG